ncbi:MAG: glycosyltransferase, partial [Candidatus Paceibacteria bacterium]
MKIGYISPTKFNKPGGHRTYGIRTIETLCQKHAVTVFNIDSEYNKNNFDYYSNYEDYIQDEEETGVKNQAIPAHLRQVATSLRTMDIIRRKELDLIYVDGSFFIRPIVGYIASQLHNIPVIIGVSDQHSRDIITGNKFYEILNGPVRKHILKNADHLILESQIILDDLKEQGINPNDFTVVPIAAGINLERF